MTSVGEILDYKKSEDEDYYAILGCNENSTVEQMNTEYKVRALQYHPDKNEGNKEAEQKFQLLKEAKETLCDPAKRINYDKWKSSGIAISYKQWLGMKEHVHQILRQELYKGHIFERAMATMLAIAVADVLAIAGADVLTLKRHISWLLNSVSVDKSMHWRSPKTKDRMLESGGNSGPSSLGAASTSPAHRRASEGGANLHWGGRGKDSTWNAESPNSVVNKFRNYEI